MVCFARGDDPIEFLRAAPDRAQSFLGSRSAKRQFVFSLRSVSNGFDSSAATKFPGGHAKGAIDFFGRNNARTSCCC